MTSGKKHFRELDIAKGIGIILVVFGHSITQYYNQVSGIWSIIYNFIYNFHMPFFFMISGILSARLLGKSIQEKKLSIQKKTIRLMVPYFFIGLLFIPINILLSGIKRNAFQLSEIWTIFVGNNPEGELWYLYVLFVYSVFAILFINRKNINIFLVISFAIMVISPYLKPALPSIGLGFSLRQLFPFVLGLRIGMDYEKAKALIVSKKIILPICILIPLIVVYYATGCSAFSFSLTIFMLIVLLFLSSIFEQRSKHFSNTLEMWGGYSMDIYILHHPAFVVLRVIFGYEGKFQVPIVVFTVVGTVAIIIGSCIVSKYLIRKSKFLSFHILGIKR